jgi:glutathione S-transferase
MILIGQYDSPYVRRVGIALVLYGLAFEHRPWSVFRDQELLRPINPLLRVPTLVLADGTALSDSHIIIDHLDSLVAPEAALFPRAEPERHKALRIATLATGLGDLAVGLFYELRMHEQASDSYVARRRGQISGALAALEAERLLADRPWWFGERPGHADIASACMIRFVRDAHPGLFDAAAHPALADHAARLEETAVFRQIQQPFIAPA